jgi:hypothetical protein
VSVLSGRHMLGPNVVKLGQKHQQMNERSKEWCESLDERSDKSFVRQLDEKREMITNYAYFKDAPMSHKA